MWVVLVRTIPRIISVLREVPCHVDHDFLSVDELHKGRFAVEGPESQGFSFHCNSSFVFQVRMACTKGS